MYRKDSELVYSPTDICNFVESRFASWMDRYALERPGEFAPVPPGDYLELLIRRGREYEDRYLASLIEQGQAPLEIQDERDRFRATHDAMRRGEPLIWQAALAGASFRGYADLLVKVAGESDLGDYHYLPRDVKLGVSAKPKYVLQLCAYADLLERVQGRRPETLELILGTGDLVGVCAADHYHYYIQQREAFLEFQRTFDPAARPVPEARADHGDWSDEAAAYFAEVDHLSLVAGIRASQIGRLEAVGIGTMQALAETEFEQVPKLDRNVFARLRRQARLQRESVGRDRPAYEVIVPDPAAAPRGLALLPPPSAADLYFDMEGFPMIEGGLEYLFGVSHHRGDELEFSDWWAHDRDEEKSAFEGFIDWAHARWLADCSLHIYHYHHYETTALKRLAGAHATREAELEQLLRNDVFVDLYIVARQGVCVGESGYTLKHLEHLFRDKREGEVTSAGGSIVEYRRFRDSGESREWKGSPILRAIRDYNRDDCESTAGLADWLRRRQRESGVIFRRGRR